MSTSVPHPAVLAALAGRRLLEHPFYRRWDAGDVSSSDLAAYAAQYRHFEAYVPHFLAELVADLPEGPAKDLVAANLADELGDPLPHLELFERFAGAVGAGHAGPSPAMGALLAVYRDLLAKGSVHALGGFLAYECQAAEVALAKAEGLRNHYGLSEEAISFWAHHAEVDERHAAWSEEAFDAIAGNAAGTEISVRAAADAWWGFLDEREAAREAFVTA